MMSGKAAATRRAARLLNGLVPKVGVSWRLPGVPGVGGTGVGVKAAGPCGSAAMFDG